MTTIVPKVVFGVFLGLISSTQAAYMQQNIYAVVSVKKQKLIVVQQNKTIASYPVSTSKFGLGDYKHRYTTPTGWLQVVKKIGDRLPLGAVFHHRKWTGEVLKPNAPGRDPIVSRILWLSGIEKQNKKAFGRGIYIHGTAEEKKIGKPASYGCIRMRSEDIIKLFDKLPLYTLVGITPN
jgi:lipoprotein-anchoring transpeptidase ErfK/SrfK